MTTALMEPATSDAMDVGLKGRALRVTLHVHAWTNRKALREADQIVRDSFSITKDKRTKTNKVLIDPTEIKPVEDCLRAIYDDHIRRTLPWEDSGTRILSSTGYLDYTTAQRRLEAKLEVELVKLKTKWDGLVERSLTELGNAAKRDDYPTADQLRERYSIERDVEPFTDSSDVRFQVSEDEVARIVAHVEATQKRRTQGMFEDMLHRIEEVAKRAAERLQNYKPPENGKRAESDFRDTLVTNVRDLVDILPSLNITNDKRIDRLRLDLMEVSRYDAKELKTNEQLRKKTADAAQAILDKVGAFI